MAINSNPVQILTKMKDNEEAIGATLVDNQDVPIPLTGLSIQFRLVNLDTETVVLDDVSATIVSASAGQVKYQPATNVFDTVGSFAAWFKIVGTPDRVLPYDGAKFQIRVVSEFDQAVELAGYGV